MKVWKKIFALCCLPGLLAALAGCAKPTEKAEPQGKAYFSYFDTVSYVYSYANDSAERFDDRSAEVAHILEEYHQLFDIYHEYAGVNNLCTVNRLAGGEPVEVDEALIDFLLYAKELYDRTNGEMNIMLGSVLSIWHDYRTEALDDPMSAKIPSEEELCHGKSRRIPGTAGSGQLCAEWGRQHPPHRDKTRRQRLGHRHPGP